jgi:hypothetical protein
MKRTMSGREFLQVARDVAAGATEVHWRAAVIHSYYALVLECRDALFRWGFVMPRRENMHTWVRLRFTYAADPDLKKIGDFLDELVQQRNRASYDLQAKGFSVASVAQDAIRDASLALALLDHIDGDAGRKAAAIAAIRP